MDTDFMGTNIGTWVYLLFLFVIFLLTFLTKKPKRAPLSDFKKEPEILMRQQPVKGIRVHVEEKLLDVHEKPSCLPLSPKEKARKMMRSAEIFSKPMSLRNK